MAEIPPSPFWDAGVMQPELSQLEKDLRDRFVAQYLLDYDPVAAAMRLGYLKRVAQMYGPQFLEEPYVQQKIKELQQADPENKSEALKIEQREVKAQLWRAATYTGPGSSHAARVAALSRLANINNMDGTSKTKVDVKHRGGVMFVPAIASLEDWEKAAVDSQSKLISEARH